MLEREKKKNKLIVDTTGKTYLSDPSAPAFKTYMLMKECDVRQEKESGWQAEYNKLWNQIIDNHTLRVTPVWKKKESRKKQPRYKPKLAQQLSKGLIIARYKKLTMKIRKTPAIKLLADEFGISTRNIFRILKTSL